MNGTATRPAVSPATLALYEEAHGFYIRSVEDGAPLTGLELGQRFGKGDRWGRCRIAEARDILAAAEAPADEEDANGMPRHAEAASVTTAERRTAIASVVIVTVAAAVLCFAHGHQVAHHAGESWRAFLFPLSVDGLVAAASTLMNIRRRRGEKVGALCKLSLGLGLAMTLAVNIVAADLDAVPLPVLKAVVGGWAPVAFGLASELVREVVAATRRPVE